LPNNHEIYGNGEKHPVSHKSTAGEANKSFERSTDEMPTVHHQEMASSATQ
jgi:hypothetical protein